MSLDITFQKEFTIEDVERITSIRIKYQKNGWWMCKNNSTVLIKCYTQTEEDVECMKSQGFEIIEEGAKTHAVKGSQKELIRLDKGKENVVDGLTCYSMNQLSEILDELVLTFQTKFITDLEEDKIWRNEVSDADKVYNEVAARFGYKIENGVILKQKN